MAEKNARCPSFIEEIPENTLYVVEDYGSGSKGELPVVTGTEFAVTLVHVDKGLVAGLPAGNRVSDKILLADKKNTDKNAAGKTPTEKKKDAVPTMACFIELKGTDRENEVAGALDQLTQTLSYDEVQPYLKNRRYVIAVIAGMPNKSLPGLLNLDQEVKSLVRKLFQKCSARNDIKNMAKLLFLTQPNKNTRKPAIKGQTIPYTVLCHKTKEGAISFPEFFIEKITEKI